MQMEDEFEKIDEEGMKYIRAEHAADMLEQGFGSMLKDSIFK